MIAQTIPPTIVATVSTIRTIPYQSVIASRIILALTPSQKRIVREIVAEGNRRGASRKQIKAAIETAVVESGIKNVKYGDRDSLGVFQQRPSQGWGSPKQVTNVRYAAGKFFEAAKRADKGQPSHVLAQDVQRSAFPDRYRQVAGQAGAILRGQGGSNRDSVRTAIPGVDRSGDRQALLRQYLATQHDPDALLGLAKGLEDAQDTPARTVPTGGRPKRVGGGDESKRVIELSRLAHSLGLQTTSGKRGTVKTASGGVSDHYKGNTDADARDLSGTPQAMRRAAREIARRLGVKYKPGVTNVVKDGYRYQLIHQTNVGGNHYDHVHIGVKRVK